MRNWRGDSDGLCALCNKHIPLHQSLVVCQPCFKNVMTKLQPVPVLFAKWSKDNG